MNNDLNARPSSAVSALRTYTYDDGEINETLRYNTEASSLVTASPLWSPPGGMTQFLVPSSSEPAVFVPFTSEVAAYQKAVLKIYAEVLKTLDESDSSNWRLFKEAHLDQYSP